MWRYERRLQQGQLLRRQVVASAADTGAAVLLVSETAIASAQAGVLRAAAMSHGRLQCCPLDSRLSDGGWPPLLTWPPGSQVASWPSAVASLTR